MPTYVKQDGTADSKTINGAIVLAAAADGNIVIQDSETYGTQSGGESDFSTDIGYALTGSLIDNFIIQADTGQNPILDGTGCYGTLIDFWFKNDCTVKGLTIQNFGNDNGGLIGAAPAKGLLVEDCTIYAHTSNCKLLHNPGTTASASPIIVNRCIFHNAGLNYYQSTHNNVIIQDSIFLTSGSSYAQATVNMKNGVGNKAINVTFIATNRSHNICQISGAYNCVALTTEEFGSNFGRAFDVNETYNCVAYHGNVEFTVAGAKVDCIEAYASGSTYGDLFEDFSGSNFTPLQTGYLYKTGLSTGSGTDLSGSARQTPYDIGAYKSCDYWTGYGDGNEKTSEEFIINRVDNTREEFSRRNECANENVSAVGRPPAGTAIKGLWNMRNRKTPYIVTLGSQTPDDITN